MAEINCGLCLTHRMGICLDTGLGREKSDSICDDFKPKEFYWCAKSNCWLDVIVCVARRSKGMDDCKGCRDGQRYADALRHNSRRGQVRQRRNQVI